MRFVKKALLFSSFIYIKGGKTLYQDSVPRIDIKRIPLIIKKKGYVKLIVEKSNARKEERIELGVQKTNFGEKYFFICPYCGEYREHLYLVNFNLKCRECGNIRYRSTATYRNGMEYCDLKIEKILNKLKVEHKIVYYTGDLVPYIKPKGMRWTTYNKLISELRYWQQERDNRWFREACNLLSRRY